MDNNNLKISISYITNFKPSDFLSFKNLKIFKSKNEDKLISRNFFLLLLLLKHVNSNTLGVSTTLFVKPNFKKVITLLRAPYRYKLSRHQFVLSRYYIVLSILTNFKVINLNCNTDLIYFINLIKNFYIWFESSIVYQHQVKFKLKFNYKNNFLIN